MKILKNENTLDRLIRVILFEIFFLIAFFWSTEILAIIFYILAFIMLTTATTGFCGIYKIFGINTNRNTNNSGSKTIIVIFSILFILIATIGIYYSNFFTKKFFLEDYNRMNNYYKQTLFYTGQEKRDLALENYNKLVSEYAIFNTKYQKYHPYVISGDKSFNNDLSKISNIIIGLKDKVSIGDLKSAHTEFEQIRPIFQDILKRNNFSMLAIYLVDFHDAMEKIIEKSDSKDSTGAIAVYPEVSEKLKAVESIANDSEIQVIRQKLEEVLSLAKNNKSDLLSAKAAELKSAFVKVYLKRG